MDLKKLTEQFDRYLKENSVWMSRQRLDYSLKQFFKGCDLTNKSILEIGAGDGFSAVWCILQEAEKIVALEPEASGSSEGMQHNFGKMAQYLGLERAIEYIAATFEQYITSDKPKTFDYILMQAVINHLDEEATKCLHMPKANAERQRYLDTFKKMFDILKPGGSVMIYDVGRHNFWNNLKLKNPISPTIEYEKHQQPKTWCRLLCQSGFEPIDSRWFTPYKLRFLCCILSYWLPAYFLNSAFILRCRKPA